MAKKLKIGQKKYYGECLNATEHLKTVINLITLTSIQQKILQLAITEVIKVHIKNGEKYAPPYQL